MTDRLTLLRRRAGQAGLAVLTAILLVTGAAWRTTADSQTAATHAALPPVARRKTSSAARTKPVWNESVKPWWPASP